MARVENNLNNTDRDQIRQSLYGNLPDKELAHTDIYLCYNEDNNDLVEWNYKNEAAYVFHDDLGCFVLLYDNTGPNAFIPRRYYLVGEV